MSRNSVVDVDDDGFQSKWEGHDKRVEVSRDELLGKPVPINARIPKATAAKAARAAAQQQSQQSLEEVASERVGPGRERFGRVTRDSYGEHDTDHDDEYRRTGEGELQQLAVDKSKDVTSGLHRVLRIAEDTKGIGAQTLVTLQEQGEQLSRTHEKIVQVDQELAKGEKLLGKLGPMFSFWKPKKGKKIVGPSYHPGDEVERAAKPGARAELFGKGGGDGGGKAKGGSGNGGERTYQDDVQDEVDTQDQLLDSVSDALKDMKNLALEMGKEMGRQDKALDDVSTDLDTLNRRQTDAIKRGRRIVGARRG